jgi:hypothetical protein
MQCECEGHCAGGLAWDNGVVFREPHCEYGKFGAGRTGVSTFDPLPRCRAAILVPPVAPTKAAVCLGMRYLLPLLGGERERERDRACLPTSAAA